MKQIKLIKMIPALAIALLGIVMLLKLYGLVPYIGLGVLGVLIYYKWFKVIPYIAIAVLAILLYSKWNQPVIKIQSNSTTTKAEVIYRYKDDTGADHVSISKNANRIKPEILSDPTKVPGFVDTASRALKIAKEEIDQATKLRLVAEANLLVAQKIIDSLGVESYYYSGKHLTVVWKRGKAPDHPNGYFNYRYTADLTLVDYTKTKKFLGITVSKKAFSDFYLSDTSAYISGDIQRITIDRSVPNPLFKINAGYQYNLQENSHGYGPGIRFEKGPVDLQVNQLYWPASRSWKTSINAHLTLKNIF